MPINSQFQQPAVSRFLLTDCVTALGIKKTVAADAIKNLAALNAENQARKGELGSIRPLVDLLQKSDDNQKEIAAEALRNLASNNSVNLDKIVSAGTVPLLVDLVRGGECSVQGKLIDIL